MTLFDLLVAEALKEKSDLNPLAMVVEKELLHHDILREMGSAGLLEKLAFIGGPCLRMCNGSSRLSEDLDFSAGKNFNKESLKALPQLLTGKLFVKYGLIVQAESREEILADIFVALSLRPYGGSKIVTFGILSG
jgi:predicted nucleotidyltransferase component of viral defense system